MKINSISSRNISFKEALSTYQEKKAVELQKQIQQQKGHQDGYRVVKIYVPALPVALEDDIGIGKINTPEAENFFHLAKVYGGANMVKVMPWGPLTDKQVYNDYRKTSAYDRGALALGEDIINIKDLADDKWGNIIPRDTVNKLVEEHKSRAQFQRIDFETTLGYKNQESIPTNESVFRIAFKNFKEKQDANENLLALRKEFEAFKNQKEPVDYDDIYTRLALFPYLKNWTTAKTDFFIGFDADPEIRARKMPEYEALKEKFAYQIDFYKFKQFLAHKALEEGRNLAHKEGILLQGDCPIGNSWVEEQCFPDAILKDGSRTAQMGVWGSGALNFYDLMYDKSQNSPAHKYLRAKITHNLLNYDAIRFDVGWAYMRPAFHYGDRQFIHLNAGTTITDFIEKVAYEVKGPDFDQRRLMYECDADGNDFNLRENSNTLRAIKGLAILSTEEEKNDNDNIGWGNIAFLKQDVGLGDDDISLQTNNHDGRGVMECCLDKNKSSEQVGGLLRVFNLQNVADGWRKLKDDSNIFEHISKYVRARFAEITMAKHSCVLFTDLLGRDEKVDYHTDGRGPLSDRDYKNRLENEYEENFHLALQNNKALNYFEAQAFRMEHDGDMYKNRELYENTLKYAAYLKRSGSLSRIEADNSPRANIDISSLSLDEIKNL